MKFNLWLTLTVDTDIMIIIKSFIQLSNSQLSEPLEAKNLNNQDLKVPELSVYIIQNKLLQIYIFMSQNLSLTLCS